MRAGKSKLLIGWARTAYIRKISLLDMQLRWHAGIYITNRLPKTEPSTVSIYGLKSAVAGIFIPVADILLCLLRLCLISGNFLHWRCATCVWPACLAGPGAIFLRAGALQASLFSRLAASLSSHHAPHVQWVHLHTHDCLSPCASVTQLVLTYHVVNLLACCPNTNWIY
jgi:hypothetical protein